MSLNVTIISKEVTDELKAAYERARQNPIPKKLLVEYAVDAQDGEVTFEQLRERPPEMPKPQRVEVPFGIDVAISFEEQPVGLCSHFSFSVATPGMTPSVEVVTALLATLGKPVPPKFGRIWLEEFRPGHHCVCIVYVEEEDPNWAPGPIH